MSDSIPSELPLAEGFEEADYASWRATVEKALKGADFEKALATPTYDGMALQPLYTEADRPEDANRPATGRGARAGLWDIRQAATGPDAAAVNAQIKEDLSEGATSALIRFDTALRSGETVSSRPDLVGIGGAALHGPAALREALSGVDLASTPIALDAGAAGLAAGNTLAAMGPLAAGGSLGLDPLSAIATAGLGEDAVGAWAKAAANFDTPAFRMTATGAPVYDAGGSNVQELGAMAAAGVAYLRALEVAGVSPLEAAEMIHFRLSISQDQFLTVAKARAARAIWAAVLKHAGASGASMRLDGMTSERMLARHDLHSNVLRGTIAAFAGAVGGLDGLTVLPFDARIGARDPLARRIARNIQLVLVEESNLGKVADPAGGSYFVERLTADFAREGWAFFQAIERAGGLANAYSSGMVAEKVAEVVDARTRNLANRKDAITGVSEFANLAEDVQRPPDFSGLAATLVEEAFLPEPLAGERTLALRPTAAPFEALRDASDAKLRRDGARPSVFLANIGALAEYNVRATFAANAFAAGGVIATGDVGFQEGAAVAVAFGESGAKIACICGTDGGYGDHGADFAKALKSAGAKQVWLAGRPSDDLKAAGVDGFIHMGVDILAALQSAHTALEV